MKKLLLTITLIVGAFLTVAWTQSRPQWEYKFQINISERKANELGSEGWELVAVSTVTNVQEYVFRRTK